MGGRGASEALPGIGGQLGTQGQGRGPFWDRADLSSHGNSATKSKAWVRLTSPTLCPVLSPRLNESMNE